jgi:multiple sugar transport system substrate-binding protein
VRWFTTVTDTAPVVAMQLAANYFNNTQTSISLTLETGNLQALQNAIASGSPPDMVGPMGIDASNYFHGQWLDLTPWVASTGLTLTDFYTEALDLYRENGDLLGLPVQIYPSYIYYNKDLFDTAGLAYPPHQYGQPYTDSIHGGPWKIEKVEEIARLLTLDNMGRNATHPAFDSSHIVQFGYYPQWIPDPRASATLFGAGSFVDASGNAQIPSNWRTAFHWYYSGAWEEFFIPNDPNANSAFGGSNVFNSGHLAMANSHLWYTCCFSLPRWDIAAVPAYSGTPTAKLHADGFRILSITLHPTETFQALTYLSWNTSLADAIDALPGRLSMQAHAINHLQSQYPGVDWQVMLDSVAFSDKPSHEGYLPNYARSQARIQQFRDLFWGTAGLNVDTELNLLQKDLQRIFHERLVFLPLVRR